MCFPSAVKAAIRDPNPVVFLENELMYGTSFPISAEVEKDDFVLPMDKAKIMRAGTDITLVSFSRMVGLCLQAADILAKEGIQAEVRCNGHSVEGGNSAFDRQGLSVWWDRVECGP